MKQKNAQNVQEFLNDLSEYDREQVQKMWIEALQTDCFNDPLTPLAIFRDMRPDLLNVRNEPGLIAAAFEKHTEGLNTAQKQFVAQKTLAYFKTTVFDDDPEAGLEYVIIQTLNALNKRLKRTKSSESDHGKTATIRQTLYNILQGEMERIPEYLAQLETKDRLNILCKIMPYVLPRIESITLEAPDDDSSFPFS